MKAAVKKTYGKKGDDIVNMNWKAIDVSIGAVEEIKYPESWADHHRGRGCGEGFLRMSTSRKSSIRFPS